MHIHGSERRFNHEANATSTESQVNTLNYGIFNGQVGRGVALGMYEPFVSKQLGKAARIEKLDNQGPGLVARHHYKQMVLEYDRLKNGNVVLAGVILEKPAGAKK